MNPEKVGKFIKKIRKENKLTQKQFADKYKVSYQLVSKWEKGEEMPDASLIKKMSKDFHINIENDIKEQKNKKSNIILLIIIFILIILIILVIKNNNKSFKLKTLSTSCNQLIVSASIISNENKSSAYISNIDYCGDKDNNKYEKIQCNLYETDDKESNIIDSYKSDNKEITIEEYLKTLTINIDNYEQKCNQSDNNSLYLGLTAEDKNGKIKYYKIPIKLEKCSK